METIQSLKRRIDSTNEIHSVVRTMKALAAAGIRRYEEASESVAQYQRTIDLGWRAIVHNWPQTLQMMDHYIAGRRLLIVFGSDYGMAGRFNDHAHNEAMSLIGVDGGRWEVWTVGALVAGRLADAGFPPAHTFGLAGSAAGVAEAVQDLTLALGAWRSQGGDGLIMTVHNRPTKGVAYEPVRGQLYPLDTERLAELTAQPWPGTSLPLVNGGLRRTLRSLVTQTLYIHLHRAAAESLAAEYASRLAAMQAAEKKVSQKKEELYLNYHQRRQSSITSELLDIVSGFEALTK